MTAPANGQSDTEVVTCHISYARCFSWADSSSGVDQSTVNWKVTVGLSLLFIVSQQILLKTILPP
jgi:hypothetical protein